MNKPTPRSRRAALSASLLWALLLASPAAWSAMITVNTLLDDGTDGTACSLREAIGNANANNNNNGDCEAGMGDDTINFADTDGVGETVAGGTIILTQGVLDIDDSSGGSLTIEGADADDARTTVTADDDDEGSQGDSRLFNVQSTATLNSLRLVSGYADGGNGGAIINSADLTITDSRLNSSRATGSSAAGGAIYNDTGGALTVTDTTLNGNSADSQGGAIADASGNGVTLDGVNFVGNLAGVVADDENSIPAQDGDGGALYLPDGGTLTGCAITSNAATRSGGAIYNAGGLALTRTSVTTNQASGDASDDGGGGIYNAGGTVTLDESGFSGNVAVGDDGAGGGILSDGGSINAGSDGTDDIGSNQFASQGATHRGGAIALINDANATFYRAAFQSNQAGTAADEDDDGNEIPAEPGFGGAINADGDSDLTLDTVSFAQNVALTSGGAIWRNGGTLTADFVQWFNNVARGDTNGDGGGAVFNDAGDITATNIRMLGNAATGAADDSNGTPTGGSGGALLSNGGSIGMTDANLNRNSAERAGGAIEITGGNLTLTRAILGGDDGGDGNLTGGSPGNGGAVHIGGGTVNVDDSTVAYNTAAQGGGLWNSGAGTLNVTNSTVSNNQAVGSDDSDADGGGIYQIGGGTASLRFATVVRNDADGNGGGIAVGNGGGASVTLASSIVAENSADGPDDDYPDNAVTASNSVTQTGEAGIAGLQLYGGPTFTHPLNADSPALEAGANCADTGIDNLDQRGATRPFDADGTNGAECDAGAYELTDDAVLRVTRNGPDSANVDPSEDTDTVVLAFQIRNPDPDNAVTVGGFNIRPLFNGGLGSLQDLLANDPDAALNFEVVLDANGNGELDDDETSVVGQDVDDRGAAFQFDGGGGRAIAAGGDQDFLVVLRIPQDTTTATQLTFPQAPLYAGGLLLGLLGLVRVRGTRRRTQWLLAIAMLVVGLTACSEGDDPIPPPPGPDPVLQGELRFELTQLTPPTAATGSILIGDGLPVYGPALNVQ